ncbi:MAG TPA: Rieske (2Fe-2S) protein, partial [Mycobacterium sp.]|nr:Rieske (2Fe-2S) protein [Mycobacterium sp.]
MSGRSVRRFVDGLLRGQPTERAQPDDVEAQEMRTAIELRAARLGSDAPREEFVTDLHRRLADAMEEPQPPGLRTGR